MKKCIGFSEFYSEFQAVRPDNFSYEGLVVLFEYLEDFEEQQGEELELDVIALCCDISESTWEDVISDHSIDVSDTIDPEQVAREYLEYNTVIIGETDSGAVLYYQFRRAT